MRICLITDYLSPSYGWGRHSLGIIRALRDLGVTIEILSPQHLCDQRDLIGLPNHHHVPSFVKEARGLLRLSARSLPSILAASRGCDVIHCLPEPYVVPAALAAGSRPLFVTAHGTYAVRPLRMIPDRWWLTWAYQRAARVVCVSRFTRSQLTIRLPGTKTAVVPEGIEAERFRIETPSPSARPFLLSVAPIKRRKGYQLPIEAFAQVHAQRPELEYWIAGATDDPVFQAELRQRVGELGLNRAVRWLGRVDDKTLIELYRPVIGTTGCGAEDAIRHEFNGLLVPPDDADSAAKAVLRLLANPGAAEEMGRRGRELVLPWRTAANQLVALYDYHCQRAKGVRLDEPVTGYPSSPE